jgi:tripartite-type tricarboxylate transporter receptor subunit TctC
VPALRALTEETIMVMRLPRRRFLHLAAGAAALPAVSRSTRAQGYPMRPVRIVVGFAAGGAADITARLIGQWLSERLGQPFVVENRPGAAGNIATEAVVRSTADGYTLLLVSLPQAFNATLYDNLNFDVVRDIAPIASINRAPGVMEVNPSVPAKTVPEFIAYAKANPGKLNMASAGSGSVPHVYGELFKNMTGIDMIGGQVQVMFDTMSSSIEYIRAGKLRALAVTTATRLEVLPDLPTVGDFVRGYEASGWQGIGAPRNTPAEIVDRLNKEVNVALADPNFRARLATLGSAVFPGSPADFGKLVVEETEKWGNVIRAANIKPE